MPVQLRKIGSQGLMASSLGFGAMGLTAFYGPPSPDDASMKVIKTCLDHGVNLIDTAEVYRSDVANVTRLSGATVHVSPRPEWNVQHPLG